MLTSARTASMTKNKLLHKSDHATLLLFLSFIYIISPLVLLMNDLKCSSINAFDSFFSESTIAHSILSSNVSSTSRSIHRGLNKIEKFHTIIKSFTSSVGPTVNQPHGTCTIGSAPKISLSKVRPVTISCLQFLFRNLQ